MLRVRLPATNAKINDILESELVYISFKHSGIADLYTKLVNPDLDKNQPINRQSGDLNDDAEEKDTQCEDVKLLVKIYFDEIRDQLKNQVPKFVVKFLIFFVKENLQDHLVEKLNRVEMLDVLLSENADIPFRRTQSDRMLQALGEAIEIINEIEHHQL